MAQILLVIKGPCVDTWVKWHFDLSTLVSLLERTNAAGQAECLCEQAPLTRVTPAPQHGHQARGRQSGRRESRRQANGPRRTRLFGRRQEEKG